MSENKFKVGDRVRCIKSISADLNGPYNGQIFEIISVDGNAIGISVPFYKLTETGLWYHGIREGLTPNWHYSAFELLPKEALDDEKTTDEGIKLDSEKPDLSLIPKEALDGIATALGYGAKKYNRNNYKKGLEYTRLVAAAMRHISAFNSGKDNDDESGLNHIDHALATLAMLKWMIVNKKDMDNRSE